MTNGLHGVQSQNVAIAFQLKSFGNRKVKRDVIEIERAKNGKYLGLKRVAKEQDAGELALFPKGHSIRVTPRSKEDAGLNKVPALVDMDTGEALQVPTLMQQLALQQQEATALPESSDAVLTADDILTTDEGDKS